MGNELVLKNAKMYMEGYDISGDMNQVTLTHSADLKDKTVFGSSARKRKAGLFDTAISAGGFWNSSEGTFHTTMGRIDPIIFDEVGSSNELFSVIPDGTQARNIAYFQPGITAEYSPSGSIGEMFEFSFAGYGQGKLVRGKLLECGWFSTVPTAGHGNIAKLGADSTAKAIALGIHVTRSTNDGAGGSLVIELARDYTTDFSGAPSTIYSIAITTGDLGKAEFHTTIANESTHHLTSYRVTILQQGTSDDQLGGAIVVGHR